MVPAAAWIGVLAGAQMSMPSCSLRMPRIGWIRQPYVDTTG